jgi:hypothetical protein
MAGFDSADGDLGGRAAAQRGCCHGRTGGAAYVNPLPSFLSGGRLLSGLLPGR